MCIFSLIESVVKRDGEIPGYCCQNKSSSHFFGIVCLHIVGTVVSHGDLGNFAIQGCYISGCDNNHTFVVHILESCIQKLNCCSIWIQVAVRKVFLTLIVFCTIKGRSITLYNTRSLLNRICVMSNFYSFINIY